MSEMKVGDVVQLRSGGSLMTVGELSKGGENVVCQWITDKGEVKVAKFSANMLRKADDEGLGEVV